MSTDSTMTPTDKTSPASERVGVAWRSKDHGDSSWTLTPYEPTGGLPIREPLFSLAQLEAVEARALAAEARVAVLEKAQAMAQAIVDGYPNPNISHEDYRVQVARWAEDYLAAALSSKGA